jgi:hypothetical protein
MTTRQFAPSEALMGNRARIVVGSALLSFALVSAGCSCSTPDSHAEDGGGNVGDARIDGSARDASADARLDADVGAIDGSSHGDGAMSDDGAVAGDGAMPGDGATADGGTARPCAVMADCEDGLTCTIDACVSGACTRTISTTVCTDDGLFCNGGSACAPTSSLADTTTGCAPTPAPVCDDGASCTTDTCDEAANTCVNTPTDAACDDGHFCSGTERCAPGAAGAGADGCIAGVAPVCDDGLACTTDACSAVSDTCVATPVDATCNDGLVCDGTERCMPSSATADARGCVAGTMPSCDDGAGCTMDQCSEVDGGCVHVATDSLCADGLFCDGVEHCAPGAGANAMGCVAGTAVSCPSDGVACTVDACSEAAGACVSTPNASSCSATQVCDPAVGCVTGSACTTSADCDDANVCNGAETCVANICRAGAALSCGDSVACTVDSCDPTAGCQHVVNDAICDDHLVCNGIEACSATLGCRAGTSPICGDAFACTADSCSEAAGGCVHTPNDAACSNGTFCDGAEQCVVGVGCQASAPPTCADAFACTTDTCSAATDACAHTPVNALCNDGQYCDGVETCSAALGCLPGTAPNCNDGLACSDDTCVEATDSCDHNFNAANCGSGMVCTASGCQTGQACTGPTASVCNDGQYCNGVETCSSSTSTPGTCQAGTAPSCNDGAACTTDLCSNAIGACTHSAWDQDGDSYPDANCFGIGNDCNDANPAIHPGVPDLCDGIDRNCDEIVNHGLLGDGASCTTPSMCCDGACSGNICTLPSTTCRRTQAVCTTSADCCSGRCAVGVDGARRCQVFGGCSIGGEACATAADCCSTACVGGTCADGPACRTQSQTCSTNAQCCSNRCVGGTCATAGSGCQVDGEVCSSAGGCCSGMCVAPSSGGGASHCGTHDSCRAGGEICTSSAQCCDGGCNLTTHRCEILGSCSVSGEPCTGQRDCCSALCADAGSGVRICQHLDGCRPYGETCTMNRDCCSNQCGAADAVGVRRCVNPPGCVDAGEICAQGGSDDCCVLRHFGCEPTGLGVSRCNDTAACIMTGQTCDFSAQCCNGADCLLDGAGVRRCSTMCIGDGFACLADSDCCAGVCLDGFCNPSSGGCTPLGDACATSSACCSNNCDGVCYP